MRLDLLVLAAVWTACDTPANAQAHREPAGPSSRKTPLAITEIMYHPSDRPDGKDLEFIELHNSDPTACDLSGYRLDGEIDFVFPEGTTLAAGGFLVVARSPTEFKAVYAVDPVLGGYEKRLANDRGRLRLLRPAGAIVLEIEYEDTPPWPVSPDGTGHSLVLARPSLGENHPDAWSASSRVGGSPGAEDPIVASPLDAIKINEFLARTDDPELDFVELYNHGGQTVDLSGCFLSDEPQARKFTIPENTQVGPGGFIAFDQTQLGFSLSAAGERIFLTNPDATRVLDAIRYEGQALGVSSGRFPDGSPGFHELSDTTPGAANSPLLLRDIVINEIMFRPISADANDEYVELFNRGVDTVDLSGWQFVSGIEFTFPPNSSLPPGGYVVVGRNAQHLIARYPELTPANTLGNYSGALANGGERLALARPEGSVSLNPDQPLYHVVIDEVSYRDGGRWGDWADGGGSSLELMDPHSDNRHPANWADSDETAKSEWTLIEHTGLLDHGRGRANALQILAQGRGEYQIDDVGVVAEDGANLVENSSFLEGTAGWLFQGSHDQTSIVNPGFDDARALHLRAATRGDTGPNRIHAALSRILRSRDTASLRARVRWLRGHPELLLRLSGNYLEAFGPLNLPENLGTPGAPNSQLQNSTGPTIDLAHPTPTLPAPGQDTLITTLVTDPDGVAEVRLVYRVDPSNTRTAVPMRDDGQGADQVGGDGLFSATLPGQAEGITVAFHVEATDLGPNETETTYPPNAPIRECLIRFGETRPQSTFGTYRIWTTRATRNRWIARNKMDNTPLPATFVYGDHRVVHNIGALYAGSPHISPGYTSPNGRLCGYVLVFPKDDRLFGEREIVLDWPDRDASKVQEHSVYWMAGEIGLPTLHRRFIHLHFNGVTETARGGIYEDAQQVNSSYLRSWYPADTGGRLFKIEQWFEFDVRVNRTQLVPPTLERFVTTDGTLKRARYRWNWLQRAVQDSANDYADIFDLVEALNTADDLAYTRRVEALVDVEQWMRIFALEHVIGNFDSYGHSIGKNMYAYKPPGGRWQMHMWDIDWLMNASSARVTPTSPLFESEDPTVARMYAHPPFRRAYFRALRDLADGPLRPEKINPYLDHRNAALSANGVRVGSTTAGKNWLRRRRDYLLQQLAAVDVPFAITLNNGLDFTVSDNNLLTLEGTAPIEVSTLRTQNGLYPVTWTSINTWQMEIPLQPGTQHLTLSALDVQGRPLAGLTDSITVTYTGNTQSPNGQLLINEIHLGAGQITLTWESEAGRRYGVEYTDDLRDRDWQPLTQVIGEARATSVGLPLDSRRQCYYRLLRLD